MADVPKDIILLINKKNIILKDTLELLYKYIVHVIIITNKLIIKKPIFIYDSLNGLNYFFETYTGLIFSNSQIEIDFNSSTVPLNSTLFKIDIVSKFKCNKNDFEINNGVQVIEMIDTTYDINKSIHPVDLISRTLALFNNINLTDQSNYRILLKIQENYDTLYFPQYNFNSYSDSELLQLKIDFQVCKNILLSEKIITISDTTYQILLKLMNRGIGLSLQFHHEY